MISCRNQFCDTGEKMVVLRPKDADSPYYCRSCGYVVTQEKAKVLASSEKFMAAVEPLAPPEPVMEKVVERAKTVLRGTNKSKKGGKR